MLRRHEIEGLYNRREQFLVSYNDIFKAGYKMALEDVLEIKRPVAQPASKQEKVLK